MLIYVAIMLSFVASVSASAQTAFVQVESPSVARGYEQIFAIRERPSHEFDVICKDLTYEVATIDDLKSNHACDAVNASRRKPLLGVVQLSASSTKTFTVGCQGGAVELDRTFDDVITGRVCVAARGCSATANTNAIADILCRHIKESAVAILSRQNMSFEESTFVCQITDETHGPIPFPGMGTDRVLLAPVASVRDRSRSPILILTEVNFGMNLMNFKPTNHLIAGAEFKNNKCLISVAGYVGNDLFPSGSEVFTAFPGAQRLHPHPLDQGPAVGALPIQHFYLY